MKMNKKAQGLSLNMVIVAAIALVVLVVIVMIFTGRLGNFSWFTSDCKAKQGNCVSGTSCTEGTMLSGAVCDEDNDKKPDPGKVCCITLKP